ncbi:MAG: glycosyltransferase family 2 protein [Verrucomicrobiota bacterium]|jgi:glycosyltransferase involved in cell wall biosynthesis
MTTARPVTAYTLTLNEARQMRAVLESVKWADEILVMDSFSTDGTVELAREYNARVIQEEFCGFGRLRNLALAVARHDWVLSIDADERCPPELAQEIRQELLAPRCDAYHIPRKSHFLGHWMRHGGWYPDYRQPQLFNRQCFRYNDELVHESYTLNGRLGYLRQHVLQYPWDTLEIATAKLQRYSTLMAQRYAQAGKRASLAQMLLRPAGRFFRLLVLQQGFRDGRYGLVLATLYAYYTFLKYAKLWEHQAKSA